MNDQQPEDRSQQIIKALAAFSFGQLQDYITLSGVLTEAAITLEDLKTYVDAVKDGLEKAWDISETMPDCPVCGEKLGLQAITAPPGRVNVNGWQSLWFCLSDDCNYEEYSLDDIKLAMLKKERKL